MLQQLKKTYGEALSQTDIDELPDGTDIVVLWEPTESPMHLQIRSKRLKGGNRRIMACTGDNIFEEMLDQVEERGYHVFLPVQPERGLSKLLGGWIKW